MNAEKLDAALALEPLSLHYRIEYSPEEALALVCDLPDYNNAYSEVLVDLIKTINRAVPVMNFGGDNPNNGHMHHTFDIGREYSRVLYLKIAKTYVKAWSPADWEKFIDKMRLAGLTAGVDEFMIMENDKSGLTIRFWWD